METFEKQIQLLGELKRYDEQKYTSLKEKVLIQEAKKRGYKNGNYKCLLGTTGLHDDKYSYIESSDMLCSGYVNGKRNIIYEKGKWAEIIPTMTKEEAEKKLNCKIV